MTESRATPTALGLGSNLGDREANLVAAIAHLLPLLEEPRVAPLFETRPQPPLRQPDYLNTAIVGRCRRSPDILLAELKRIERRLGRRRAPRDAARVVDIDLLISGTAVLARPELTLPHPRLRQRAFVLAPLAVVAGDWPVPPDGRTVGELLADLGQGDAVRRVPWRVPTIATSD